MTLKERAKQAQQENQARNKAALKAAGKQFVSFEASIEAAKAVAIKRGLQTFRTATGGISIYEV